MAPLGTGKASHVEILTDMSMVLPEVEAHQVKFSREPAQKRIKGLFLHNL
jgi:hypothetical protein